jgi:hypothetical protein
MENTSIEPSAFWSSELVWLSLGFTDYEVLRYLDEVEVRY